MTSSSNSKLQLGIFDLGTLSNNNSVETIENTIKMATMAEKLGYSRYWIGEHQTTDSAWRSTEIILTLLGGYTESIRVGTAGIMLQYRNPLLSAQNFKLLGNLFSGRIDLGFVKGISPDIDLHKQLLGDRILKSNTYLDDVLLVKSYLTNLASRKYLSGFNTEIVPEMWMLGSSINTFDFATKNNLNFSLSLCHTDSIPDMPMKVLKYNKKGIELKFNVLISVICSDTEKKAKIIAEQQSHKNLKLSYFGNPAGCFNFLKDMQEKYSTNEINICDLCKNSKDKFNSISLIASMMET